MAALSAVQQGKAVALFSLEMPGKDILRRMAANLAGLPILSAHEKPSKHHMDATSRAITTLYGLPLTIVDNLSTLADIDREARRLSRMKKADVVIVDYLQLVENPDADSREQAVSEVARKLKNLALNCSAVVLTASQMNEAGQLRESRAIGHHADTIINIGDDRITVEKDRRIATAGGGLTNKDSKRPSGAEAAADSRRGRHRHPPTGNLPRWSGNRPAREGLANWEVVWVEKLGFRSLPSWEVGRAAFGRSKSSVTNRRCFFRKKLTLEVWFIRWRGRFS